MSYKKSLYDKYISTHIAHRKGEVDLSLVKRKSIGFRQHFSRFLPTSKKAMIADLGCGSGELLWWLKTQGYFNINGIDTSAEQVSAAHKLNIDAVEEGDVFEFLAENKGFDLLFARDLIEHFDKQMVFDFLNMTIKSLEKNGALILQVPNAESPYFGRVRYGDFTHELAFTSSSITQLLKSIGYNKIEVYPWQPVVSGIRSLIRYVIWRIIEPLLKFPMIIESGSRDRIVTMNLIAVARK